MKLEKAIEILQFHYEWLLPLKDPDCTEATRLGIEALKRVQLKRCPELICNERLLPGETED